MVNADNLVPQSERTKEEQREIARAGGIASGEARRRKRTWRQIAEALSDKAIRLKNADGTIDDTTYDVAVVNGQFMKAIKENDTAAAKFLANLLGEEQLPDQNVTVYNVPKDTADKMQALDKIDM